MWHQKSRMRIRIGDFSSRLRSENPWIDPAASRRDSCPLAADQQIGLSLWDTASPSRAIANRQVSNELAGCLTIRDTAGPRIVNRVE
jgi:hypothetical protein